MIVHMREMIWASGAIGPDVAPPPIVVGGGVEASFDRAARLGAGWIAGGVTADEFAGNAAKVAAA